MALRIGIAGIGVVSGYGWGRQALWDGLLTGKSAAQQFLGLGERDEDVGWAARIPAAGDLADGPTIYEQSMRAAVREALTDAESRGWRRGKRGEKRIGLFCTSVLGDANRWKDFYQADDEDISNRDYLSVMPSTAITNVMTEFDFHGASMNVSATCSTGNANLLTAKAYLDAGLVDDVVIVNTDATAIRHIVRRYVKLGVAVTDIEPAQACRPFQEGTSGFVFGEAAVAVVVTRNAKSPYVSILGGALSHDGHHASSIDPSGIYLRSCVEEALANAGIAGSDVDYVSAHGPGTEQCDKAEGAAVTELFPEAGLYSIKPLTTHVQGAASLMETAIAAMSYERGLIPAPVPVAEAHPQLLRGPTPITGSGVTCKSSMGLGGHNSIVLLEPAG
jgi:3-oxoacyl-[acyl-carrier-protein] synthase II